MQSIYKYYFLPCQKQKIIIKEKNRRKEEKYKEQLKYITYIYKIKEVERILLFILDAPCIAKNNVK